MELINKIRKDITRTEYFDGADSIYIKLMILKALNSIMGSSEKKTPEIFNTIKRLQDLYKEVPDARPVSPEYFSILKKKINNTLLQLTAAQQMHAVA